MKAAPIEAVLVAAGSSSRMGGTDKLGADLAGRSVLRWSLEALADGGAERIVVVTSVARIAEIAAAEWLPDSVVAVVAGGERRQESVAAGIAALAEIAAEAAAAAGADLAAARPAAPTPAPDPVILVHDAARPLATAALVRSVAEAAARHGAAIPVLAVTETLKRLDGDRVGATVDRSDVVVAQTPQGALRSLFDRAYASHAPDGPETYTDEASLLEACRIPVHAISGEATNIKVTVPVDLQRARAMLDQGLVPGRPASGMAGAGLELPATFATGRIGLGADSHPFGPGGPLVLGGLTIEGAPRLSGHSDGDVALHAVADALLGAAGLGDLGRHFPADSRTPRGIDSRELLGTVAARVRAAGWRPVNVDMTIVGARPRLASLLPRMGDAIAFILGMDATAVNVKASTGNLGGSEGAGRSISASAVAWIVPLDTGESGGANGAATPPVVEVPR
jgi:2-C-methyl-D-erythritol 4-phosphate cytidylyltransferase/2-C-methyl-D-erythritol 2,4-cyclodiphosphate synthase